MSTDDFDMPAGVGVTFEQRGGWVVNALVEDYELTPEQAAGIVGNLGYESMGFKTLQEIKPMISGSRGGYGWAQWTADRRVAFEAWCRDQKLDPASDEANYGYLCEELDGSKTYCLDHLRKETTLDRCVFVWGRYFEVPGGTTDTYLPGFQTRLVYGQRALAGAKANPPKPAPVDPAPVVADAAPEPDSPGVIGRIKSWLS